MSQKYISNRRRSKISTFQTSILIIVYGTCNEERIIKIIKQEHARGVVNATGKTGAKKIGTIETKI